jgi:hypothetical protein
MTGALQERRQRVMRAGLRHAVQIDPRINFLAAAPELRAFTSAKRR